jgi:hypothetical protein
MITLIIIYYYKDPITLPTFKVPIFYVIDIILKKVGGPYYFHFGHHIAQIFILTYNEFYKLNILDQNMKLAKLIVTWEERAKEYKEKLKKNIYKNILGFVGSKSRDAQTTNVIPSNAD